MGCCEKPLALGERDYPKLEVTGCLAKLAPTYGRRALVAGRAPEALSMTQQLLYMGVKKGQG
jgi:hypothetical protein